MPVMSLTTPSGTAAAPIRGLRAPTPITAPSARDESPDIDLVERPQPPSSPAPPAGNLPVAVLQTLGQGQG